MRRAPARVNYARYAAPANGFYAEGTSGLGRGFVKMENGLEKITKPLLIITIFRRSNFGIDESIIKTFLYSLCISFLFA